MWGTNQAANPSTALMNNTMLVRRHGFGGSTPSHRRVVADKVSLPLSHSSPANDTATVSSHAAQTSGQLTGGAAC